MRSLFFLFFFLGTTLFAAEDTFLKEKEKNLLLHCTELPHWCPTNLFFAEDSSSSEGTIFEDFLPSLFAGINNNDEYKIERIYNEENQLTCVRLINVKKKATEGVVEAIWEKSHLSSLRVKDEKNITLLSYAFSYDETENSASLILEGNLSGKGEKEQYKTTYFFDEEGKTVKESEQNGKTVQYVYPKSKKDFLVVIISADNLSVRKAIRSTDSFFEEIVDDGTSHDINNFKGVTRRKFRTSKEDDQKVVVTVGAVDPKEEKTVVLRRSERNCQDPTKKVHIYDANKRLIGIQNATNDQFSADSFSEDTEHFIDGLGRFQATERFGKIHLSETSRSFDVFGNVTEEKESSLRPVSIVYTSRSQPCLITFSDGSKEQYIYSLDGKEIAHIFRDGHTESISRDAFGRVLEKSDGYKTTYFTYQGLECSLLEQLAEKTEYKRDIFGRVVEAFRGNNTSYKIAYDALDRVIEIQANTENPWTFTQSISLDGLESVSSLSHDKEDHPYIVSEKRRENLIVSAKSERIGDECYSYEFDERGRVLSIDHEVAGKKHMALKKTYASSLSSEERIEKETTFFHDQTSLIEEKSTRGTKRRIWLDSLQNEVLREDFEPLDANGSMRLTQYGKGKTRTIEWKFGSNKRLIQVKTGKKATEYTYDEKGRLSCKKTPLHTIFYKWDNDSLSELKCDDGSLHYQFFYDEKNHMTRLLDVISGKEVLRSFDSEDRLASDGEEGRVCSLTYGEHNDLSSISLFDGSSISYEQTENSIVARRGAFFSKKEKQGKATTPSCCRQLKTTHKDFLGEWSQEISYDALNQLTGETGEFSESYTFSPFGSLFSKEGSLASCNEDNDPIECGDSSFSYDLEGNIISHTINGKKREFSFDALGRVNEVRSGAYQERYRYDALSRLQEISLFENNVLKETRELLTVGEYEIGSLKNGKLSELKIFSPDFRETYSIELDGIMYDTTCDAHGSITSLSKNGAPFEIYRYSFFGTIHSYNFLGEEITPISPWLYSGKRLLKLGQLYDFGHRRYDPLIMRFCEKDPLGMVDGFDDRLFARNNPAFFLDATGLFAFPIDFSALKDSANRAFQKAAASTWKAITLSKNQLDCFFELRDEFEQIAFQLIGEKWTQLMGYNPDTTMETACGEEEKHPKVRITFINGILNWSCDTSESADIISKAHGNTSVHYIYSATKGFTGDIMRFFVGQAGVPSQEAKLLAKMWKRLLAEIDDENGVILHYAHSLGATDTYNALLLLTAEERKQIRVTTFGGSTMICEGLCGKSENYISTKDGIPIVDFGNYVKSSFGNMPNVHFLPSDSSFLLDHPFQGKTYRTVLELLGQKFQEEYLLQKVRI